MWISELNTKELTDPAYVAFDDGEDTYKTEFNECVENAANAAVAAADLTENEVAFTSGDAASPTAWSSVSVLTSGSTLATLFNRISTMIKNVRWLYSKLGTTDISSIGNGTVTGALSTLNGNKANKGWTLITEQSFTATGNYTVNENILNYNEFLFVFGYGDAFNYLKTANLPGLLVSGKSAQFDYYASSAYNYYAAIRLQGITASSFTLSVAEFQHGSAYTGTFKIRIYAR